MIIKTISADKLSNLGARGNSYTIQFVENSEELKSFPEDMIIIGNGTNSLFVSKQSNIFVSLQKLDSIHIIGTSTVEIDAGILLPNLITQLKKKNIGGLEFTYPVPASLGAAIYQNFGAFGKDIASFVKSVNVYNPSTKKFSTINTQNTSDFFSYRNSYFKKQKLIIVHACLELIETEMNTINIQLARISDKRQSIYPLKGTLGSIFINGINFPAGKLLDEAGLKGLEHKGARISDKHANIIINQSASTEDIYELIQIMKKTVKKKLNKNLKEEIFIY